MIPSDVHLIVTAEGPVFLPGADRLGRDVLSRVIYGARISLSIPGIRFWALSFLGLDLRAPVVSWGGLRQDAPNFRAVAIHP